MTKDDEIQQLREELARVRSDANIIHPRVEPKFFKGQWVRLPDGSRHRIINRSIDWDGKVEYEYGGQAEDESWQSRGFASEAELSPVSHAYDKHQAVMVRLNPDDPGELHYVIERFHAKDGTPIYSVGRMVGGGVRYESHQPESALADPGEVVAAFAPSRTEQWVTASESGVVDQD